MKDRSSSLHLQLSLVSIFQSATPQRVLLPSFSSHFQHTIHTHSCAVDRQLDWHRGSAFPVSRLSFSSVLSIITQPAKMVKENDTIAIIIIVLFVLLALIGFGIYRLVSIARRDMSTSSGSTSTGSHSIEDD